MRVNQPKTQPDWTLGCLCLTALLLLAGAIWCLWWLINYPDQPPPGLGP